MEIWIHPVKTYQEWKLVSVLWHISRNYRKNQLVQILHKLQITEKHISKILFLSAIIAVGYRTNSVRATQFRQWGDKGIRYFYKAGLCIG